MNFGPEVRHFPQNIGILQIRTWASRKTRLWVVRNHLRTQTQMHFSFFFHIFIRSRVDSMEKNSRHFLFQANLRGKIKHNAQHICNMNDILYPDFLQYTFASQRVPKGCPSGCRITFWKTESLAKLGTLHEAEVVRQGEHNSLSCVAQRLSFVRIFWQ